MATVFCRPTATGSNNGTSWENAYTSLQTAYNACGAGDEVWMTEGTFSHTALLTFANTNDPDVIGGFDASLTGTSGSKAGRTSGARTTLNGLNLYQGISIGDWGGDIDGFKFLNMYKTGTGSAIVSSGNTNLVYFRNCDFDNCNASGNGGAVEAVNCGAYFFIDCTMKNGSAGGVGGFMRSFATGIYMYRCYVDGNSASNDGGVINIDNIGGLSQNCVFVNNSGQNGGVLMIETGAGWTSAHCTYADNSATAASGGGAIYNKSNNYVENTILWGNTANSVAHQMNSATTVSYSVVEGGWTGTGNKSTNPQFVGTGDHPYKLTSPTSSAIDAGNSSASQYSATDYLQNARYDDLNVTNTGVGTIAYCDIGAYEYQLVIPPAVPGLRRFIYAGSAGYMEEQDPADDMALGGLAMSGDITMDSNQITGLAGGSSTGDALAYGQSGASLSGLTVTDSALNMSSQLVTNVSAATLDHHAINKSQLDQTLITGGYLKELLLASRQTNNSQGILAASAVFFTAQPVSGDTITLTDGTSTRTFGAGTGGDVQYVIGASVSATMQNFSDAVEADGTAWVSDLQATGLESINAGGVVYIIPFYNTVGDSKIYGTWATQANCQIVDYTGEAEYTKKASSNLPSSAPASSNFGMYRTKANMTPGEIHYIENYDFLDAWDSDTEAWYPLSSVGAIDDATAASGGGTKGKITVDRDYGLSVTTGIVKVSVAADRGIGFDGSGDLEIKENVNAGLEVTASGLSIDLSTSNPGLQFDGSGDLQGLADTTAGMEITASGFAIDLAASNPGIGFDGSGDLEAKVVTTGGVEKAATGLQIKIDDTPDTLDVDADGLKVVGLPSLFNVAGTAVSSNVTAANLDTLTGGGSTTLHTHEGATEVKTIANPFTATEGVTAGDPVYLDSSANAVSKSTADNDTKFEVIGIARDTVTATNPVDVVTFGPVDVLSGATAGDTYYLADTGGLATTPPTSGNWVVVVGWAQDADTLFVMPDVLHKRIA